MAPAPVVPEAGLSVGLILLAAACVFLLALNKVWEYTLGALLHTMANMVGTLPHVTILGHHVPPWNALANGINELDTWVLQAIGTGIVETEKGLHAVLGALTWVLQETADQVAGLADDTLKGLKHIRGYLIPTMLGVALGPIIRQLTHLANTVANDLAHPVRAVHKTIQVIAPGLEALKGRVRTLEAQVAAIGAAAPAIIEQVPAAIPIPKPAAIPGEITDGITSLWKRVRKFGKTLTPAGIVGLVAAGTAALGLTWNRCSNVRRHGENLCGMNTDLLESLLADTALILGTVDLVEFAKGMQGITSEIEGTIAKFWRA